MEFVWTLKHFAQDELAVEFVGSNQAPATTIPFLSVASASGATI
jgi:hypothetical protein